MSPSRTKAVGTYLSQKARADLVHLAQSGDKVAKISACTSRLKPGIGFSDMAQTVAEETGIATDDVHRILWTIWNLYQLKSHLQTTATDLIATITKSLPTAQSEDWQQVAHALSGLLDSLDEGHPLVVARKAQDLLFEHQNVFEEARLVTDVRPVFDSRGSKVLEAFIIHTLLVRYYESGESRRVAFALDAGDVAKLRSLCERAETKAAVLKEALKDLSWPTTTVGEEEDS